MDRQFKTRFAERPLSEFPIEQLCRDIQNDSSRRELTISDNGMALLAALIGKKVPQSILPVLAPSLQDILDGNGGVNSGTGGILTEAYGEMIGPLVTCLERRGDFEIIRLLWSNREKRPDILIVDKRSGKVIIQECKATCCSVNRRDNSLDVCKIVKKQKNDGAQQLIRPATDALSDQRIAIAPIMEELIRTLECSEKSVVVTAIPDGQIKQSQRQVESPKREVCPQSCAKKCLYDPEPRIITALFSERLDDCASSDNLRKFLGNYKATEKAAWGGAHGCFSNLYSNMLSSFSNLAHQRQSDMGGISLAAFLTGPLKYAVQNGLYVNFHRIESDSAEYFNEPLRQSIFATLQSLTVMQGDLEKPTVKESSVREFHKVIMGEEERESKRPPRGNWQFESRNPESDESCNATKIEARIIKTSNGQLEITFVPTQASDDRTARDIQWAIAETVGGEYAKDIYHTFNDEMVSYQSGSNEVPSQFKLGRILCLPWWPWLVSTQQLNRMHQCCPDCDFLADFMEHHWKEPFLLLHRFWRHHHSHYAPWRDWRVPTAYVTSDARGVLRIPDWSSNR